MKLTFTGESIQDIHQQIVETARSLTNVTTYGPMETSTKDLATAAVNEVNRDAASVFGEHPATMDGHVVSSGSVWPPVEGRGNAFRSIPVEEYKEARQSNGELDSEGTPYDAAIHTSTKAKTSKGVWKKRPGGAGAKQEASSPIETASQPANVTSLRQETVATPEFAQAPAPIGMAPATHSFDSFKKNLQMIIVRLINEKKITRDYMNDLNAHFKVNNLWEVASDDLKAKPLFDLFVQYAYITGV